MVKSISWVDAAHKIVNTIEQGEHILVIGQNGSGKSYAGIRLTALISWVRDGYTVGFFAKPEDVAVEQFYVSTPDPIIVQRAADIKKGLADGYRSILLYPTADTIRETRDIQKVEFALALDYIWKSGRLVVYLDELRIIADILGLKDEVIALYTQLRSSKGIIISTAQRPRWVSVEARTETRFILISKLVDTDDRKVLSDSLDKKLLGYLEDIPRRSFLVVDTFGIIEPFITSVT